MVLDRTTLFWRLTRKETATLTIGHRGLGARSATEGERIRTEHRPIDGVDGRSALFMMTCLRFTCYDEAEKLVAGYVFCGRWVNLVVR